MWSLVLWKGVVSIAFLFVILVGTSTSHWIGRPPQPLWQFPLKITLCSTLEANYSKTCLFPFFYGSKQPVTLVDNFGENFNSRWNMLVEYFGGVVVFDILVPPFEKYSKYWVFEALRLRLCHHWKYREKSERRRNKHPTIVTQQRAAFLWLSSTAICWLSMILQELTSNRFSWQWLCSDAKMGKLITIVVIGWHCKV